MGEAGVSGLARLFVLNALLVLTGCTVDATGYATDFHQVHEASIRASTAEAVVGRDGRCEADISIDP
ncbi:MAG: hypothetical protein JO105_12385, partial [Hyphomicrobiales bacterium]|nr:hypothetical protein [Hyphomicrobiales bacterium]